MIKLQLSTMREGLLQAGIKLLSDFYPHVNGILQDDNAPVHMVWDVTEWCDEYKNHGLSHGPVLNSIELVFESVLSLHKNVNTS